MVQRAATEEIRTGERVQLDWGLENVQFPGFKRKGLEQRIIDKTSAAAGWTGTDDEISFNTQVRGGGRELRGSLKAQHERTGRLR